MTIEDDDVFDDTLDTEAIDRLLVKSKNSQQRDLFGKVVTSSSSSSSSSQSSQPIIKFPPTHHQIDYNTLDTYLYPTNFELRDYQYNIVQNSFYKNSLVALPTGLGKTFIASTVMLNFHRWFPESKIIFMAPTRPLVAQQIKSFCRDTGITSNKVATFLDKSKRNRKDIWDTKSIFFTTPQVVENDLTAGLLNPKDIVLLIIDEAHRSKGNYAYSNVAKFINRFNTSYRILALTATPGSDVESVQEVVDNLNITKIEVRTESSIDTAKYLKKKVIERITVANTPEIEICIELLSIAIAPILKKANERKIYEIMEPRKINAFQAMEASQKLLKNQSIPEGLKWQNYFILQLLNVVGQALRRLVIYGIRSFFSYFMDKYKEFTTKYNNKKSTNHLAASFYFHDSLKTLIQNCETWTSKPQFLGHEKLEALFHELGNFFKYSDNEDSKVIIFTEFRESALEIVNSLERSGNSIFKPHIFIGQSKEKDKFDEDKFLNKVKKSKKKANSKAADNQSNSKNKDKDNMTSSENAQAKGMNQKMQKALINQFKKGEYNILVATSIGEEGLDIGEVDLIICYDSTSSPIKNIQRMGRTGRKRDGKVLLLFSSNEESKFDKAMGGYDYIQQHIMNNNLIVFKPSDRIIPKSYKPIVKKVFIEIPQENIEIAAQDDEDEILKIATQYMNSRKKKTPTQRHQKIEKQFFMPENVQTGFVKAKNLVEDTSLMEKDILDSFLDSDSGSESEKNSNFKTSSTDNILGDLGNTNEQVLENSDSTLAQESNKRFAPKTETIEVRKRQRTLGLKKQRSILDHFKNKDPLRITTKTNCESNILITDIENEEGKDNINNANSLVVEDDISINYNPSSVQRNENCTDTNINIDYGVKQEPQVDLNSSNKDNGNFVMKKEIKGDENILGIAMEEPPMNINKSEQLIRDSPSSILHQKQSRSSNGGIKGNIPKPCQITEDILQIFDEDFKSDEDAEEDVEKDAEKDAEDVFNDGLDIELENLTKTVSDPSYDLNFADNEGFLTEEQENLLYTMYYTTVDPNDVNGYYDPSEGIKSQATGKIGHGSKAEYFLKAFNCMGNGNFKDNIR